MRMLAAARSNGKAQLRLGFDLVALAEVRKREPEQPDLLGGGNQGVEQGAADLEEFLSARDGTVERAGAGQDLEVAILDLERDGAAADPFLLDPAPDGPADPVELGREIGLLDQILVERVLGADR